MPAYCSYNIYQIRNNDRFLSFRKTLLNSIDKFNGRFIVLGKPAKSIHVQREAEYHFIIEFASFMDAEDWIRHMDDGAENSGEEFMKSDILVFKGL